MRPVIEFCHGHHLLKLAPTGLKRLLYVFGVNLLQIRIRQLMQSQYNNLKSQENINKNHKRISKRQQKMKSDENQWKSEKSNTNNG